MDWEEKAEQLYTYLENMIQQGGDFVVDQTPLLVQEFFMWFTAHHIFFGVLGVIFILLSIYFHQIGKEEGTHKRGKSWYNESDGMWFIPVAIPYIVGIIMFLTNTYSLLQILVAPRIYLLEKLSTWMS